MVTIAKATATDRAAWTASIDPSRTPPTTQTEWDRMLRDQPDVPILELDQNPVKLHAVTTYGLFLCANGLLALSDEERRWLGRKGVCLWLALCAGERDRWKDRISAGNLSADEVQTIGVA